jgi:hypothetical protein
MVHGGRDHVALEDVLVVVGIVVCQMLRSLPCKAESVESGGILVVGWLKEEN